MKELIWILLTFVASYKVLGTDQDKIDLEKKCPNCCLLPKNFENGKITSRFQQKSLLVPEDTILTFKCRPRYHLSGKRFSICISGKWLPEIPKCIAQSCTPPPLLENGEPILKLGSKIFPVGTRIKYRCDDGYELSTDNELICVRNKSHFLWSGETPTCTAIPQCNDPGVSSDGYHLGECCYRGSVLQYRCNPGFTLIGSETLICIGENWDEPRPLCQPDEFCPVPDVIQHGRIVGEKSGDFYQYDDQISIECERGYAVSNGSDLLFCEDGHWDEEIPNCSEIKCSPPIIPENGFIHEENQTTFPFEFEVNFACQEGFLLVGNSWSSCGELGWSNPSPSCKKIQCPIAPVPESGWKKGDSNEVGAIVEYGCFSGYQLLGSSKRECLSNGKWSGELTICDAKENDCPNPGIPINGMKIGRFYKFGDVVEFKCNLGKTLIGSEKRICQKNGDWSGSEAICLDENDFDQKESVRSHLQEIIQSEKNEQEDILNEYKQILEENANNSDSLSRAIDLNHPNRLVFYFVFDISGSIGNENLRKSINFAKLLVKEIGVSKDGSRVGAMTFSNTAEIKFYPIDYENSEDVINALDTIKFTKGGGTATRLALRLLKDQMIPLTEETLKGKQKPIIFLMTDGKSNMEGDPMHDAEELKKYGVEIYCIGITGDRNMKTLYDIATTKEEHVFILDSYDTIDWLIQEIINGTVDYSIKCGIQKSVIPDKEEDTDNRGRVVGGRKATYPWPWMAALYFVDSTVGDLSKAEHRCGGSVIGKSWILTAAHCFYDKKGNLINKENIIVNLGLLNVKKRSNLQQIPIENYIIHQNFSRKSHHNDIALVKLSREAEFNIFVRPICLPPSYSKLPKGIKFYREGERAIAIGWGYDKSVKKGEEAGNPVDHLKRLNMPIQNDITCRNSLNNRYEFTDAMFCAGRGKGEEDTCKGDSGGPLMQPMINDVGQKYWTQVGIISWGEGCAQKDSYGFYTHVAKLKEWIELTTTKNQ